MHCLCGYFEQRHIGSQLPVGPQDLGAGPLAAAVARLCGQLDPLPVGVQVAVVQVGRNAELVTQELVEARLDGLEKPLSFRRQQETERADDRLTKYRMQVTDGDGTRMVTRGWRAIIGGAALRIPVIERVSRISLELMNLADVRVSAAARDAYLRLTPGVRLPMGTVVAQFQYSQPNNNLVQVFAIQKLADARWQFSVVQPDGRLVEEGNLRLCLRCHAEAVSDHLFGLPAITGTGDPQRK